MSAESTSESTVSSRSEWIKFGSLAAILLGAVLVVALLRPTIFDRIVPAVMGVHTLQPEGPGAAENAYPIMIPLVTDKPIESEAPADEAAEPSATVVPEEVPILEVEMVDEGMDEDEKPVPETTVSAIDHIVQPNENLTTIANQYNITIQAILDVNDIPNPNRIDAGTVLRIPQP